MAFPGMSKFYMPGNVQPMTIPLLVFGSTWMKFLYFTINTGSIQMKLLHVCHFYFLKIKLNCLGSELKRYEGFRGYQGCQSVSSLDVIGLVGYIGSTGVRVQGVFQKWSIYVNLFWARGHYANYFLLLESFLVKSQLRILLTFNIDTFCFFVVPLHSVKISYRQRRIQKKRELETPQPLTLEQR